MATAKASTVATMPTRNIKYLLPEQLIVVPEENGRHFESDVTDLVDSIVRVGRVMQNLTARQVGKDKYQLVFGYRRHRAVAKINAEKLTKQPLYLPVEIENVDPKQAFLQNLDENKQRRRTTAIDDAHNISRLKTMKVPDDEILKIYATDGKPKSPAWMFQRLKLLKLNEEEQRKIHNDELSADVGYFIAELPQEERTEVLKAAEAVATERSVQVETAKAASATPAKAAAPPVRGQVHAIDTGKKGAAPVTTKKAALPPVKAQRNPGKVTINDVTEAARKRGVLTTPTPRTMKHVRELFQAYTGPGMGLHCRRFCDALLKWVGGELDSDNMEKEFHKRFKESAT
jgi:ParB/RepB/Spo0J family partition protein